MPSWNLAELSVEDNCAVVPHDERITAMAIVSAELFFMCISPILLIIISYLRNLFVYAINVPLQYCAIGITAMAAI